MVRATAHPDHQCISSEDIHGTEVYGPDGKNIGEIDHLIIDKISGRVAYAVMSFGGFMGLGHSHYPIHGMLSAMTPLSEGSARTFRSNSCEMRLNSATILGKTGTGKLARIDIMVPQVTGRREPACKHCDADRGAALGPRHALRRCRADALRPFATVVALIGR